MNKYLTPLLALVVVVALGAAGYFYMQYADVQKALMSAQSKPGSTAAAAADAKVVGMVEKLIELPKDESPTLATVSDKSKLATQSFFKNAQNGDKLLIFVKSKKVILYRPSEDKIIEVGTINVSQAAPTGKAGPTEKATPTKVDEN